MESGGSAAPKARRENFHPPPSANWFVLGGVSGVSLFWAPPLGAKCTRPILIDGRPAYVQCTDSFRQSLLCLLFLGGGGGGWSPPSPSSRAGLVVPRDRATHESYIV